MIVLPGEAFSFSINAQSTGRCLAIARIASSSMSVSSNSAPCGRIAVGSPKDSPGQRFTKSSVPPISWDTTAELVVTPSTRPALMDVGAAASNHHHLATALLGGNDPGDGFLEAVSRRGRQFVQPGLQEGTLNFHALIPG